MKAPLNPKQTLEAYPVETVSVAEQESPTGYADRLLSRKLQIVWANYRSGCVVDLCCANGVHLLRRAGKIDNGVGIDYVPEFVAAATAKAEQNDLDNVRFVVSGAHDLPLEANSVSMLYSMSALYIIPNLSRVIAEIARVLSPGGRCVLDLGNRRSLNTICARQYPDAAPLYALTLRETLEACERAGLRVVERHAFQILPLWADRPRWLKPLLLPFWARLMKTTIAGRMLDERISSLPFVRQFAFRHVLVCEKV